MHRFHDIEVLLGMISGKPVDLSGFKTELYRLETPDDITGTLVKSPVVDMEHLRSGLGTLDRLGQPATRMIDNLFREMISLEMQKGENKCTPRMPLVSKS